MSTHSAECCPHNCLLRHAPSMNAMRGRTLIRKTSLLRKIEPIARRSSFANKDHLQPAHLAMNERRNDLEIVKGRAIALRDPTRIDLLFTMSEIPHADPCLGSHMRSDVFADDILWTLRFDVGPASLCRASPRQPSPRSGSPSRSWRSQRRLVEPDGIEPTTSCLQSTRSPS